jgi:hypothetical protein
MPRALLDRLLVQLQLRWKRVLIVGAVVVVSLTVVVTRSDDDRSETATPTSAVLSLADRFCADVDALDRLGVSLTEESWRTAPLGLEEDFRSWAADPKRDTYIPDAVFVFAYDTCVLDDAQAATLARKTPYAAAITYAGRELMTQYLLVPVRQAIDAADPQADAIEVLVRALEGVATSSPFPKDVSLSFAERNEDSARFDLEVPSIGFAGRSSLCMSTTLIPPQGPEGLRIMPNFNPGPCKDGALWPVALAP